MPLILWIVTADFTLFLIRQGWRERIASLDDGRAGLVTDLITN